MNRQIYNELGDNSRIFQKMFIFSFKLIMWEVLKVAKHCFESQRDMDVSEPALVLDMTIESSYAKSFRASSEEVHRRQCSRIRRAEGRRLRICPQSSLSEDF